MKKKLHSEEFFGDYRDYWWNDDFLALMALRWGIGDVKTVLDAGCGIGHWGFALEPHLPSSCKVTGIDREPEWVTKAEARAADKNLSGRFDYQVAAVEKLPFADNTFDMVTCQTLLIHVPDPIAVLQEFKRVLKAGGILLVAEPNNLTNSLIRSNVSLKQSADDLIKGVRFHLICDLGKVALGEGDSSLGDFLPGYFAELGFCNVQTYLSDKASPLIPPYESREQQILLSQLKEWSDDKFLAKSKEEAHRYFIAGGGSEEEFTTLWQWSLDSKEVQQAIAAKTYHSANGAITYLVSGRKQE